MDSKLKTKLLNSSKVKFLIPKEKQKNEDYFLSAKNTLPTTSNENLNTLRKKNFHSHDFFQNLCNFSSSSTKKMSKFDTIHGYPTILPVLIYDTLPPRLLEPIISVPYRGTPKYNTKRRLTNPILRRRSLSQSSICSVQSDRYQTPQQLRHQSIGIPSPSPSCMTMLQGNNSDYGTLKRYHPEVVQPVPRAGFE